MKKSILFISYNFPPLGGTRTIRWVQFITYLVENGYRVDVLTIRPETRHENYDENSLEYIPRGINVYRTYPGTIHKFIYKYLLIKDTIIGPKDNYISNLRTFFKERLEKIYERAIEYFCILGRIGWLPWGFRMIKKLASKNYYDVVISSSLPFEGHILGYFFKKKTKIPFIADYGDPWGFNPVFPKWRRIINSKIEMRVLKAMDHIVVTTDATMQGFINHYYFLKPERFTVIANGYDAEEFKNSGAENGKKFRIVYTGIFYDGIREPFILFDALENLKDIDFEVIIAGEILPHFIKAAKSRRLDEKVVFLGYQPHRRVISLQKGADVLLLLLNRTGGYQIPGKIFEYLGAQRPILTIQFDEKDAGAELIRKHKRGIIVNDNAKEIAFAVEKMYNLWKRRELEKQFNLEVLKEYTWRRQADKLENAIRIVVDSSKTRSQI